MKPRQHLIQEIRLRDFRCFHTEQAVPLAPLTLLLGENSTGKTSFLAAVRSIWETAFRTLQPNFREEPYDLGSFSEIVHKSNQEGVKPSSFEIGFTSYLGEHLIDFDVTFESQGAEPCPSIVSMKSDGEWIKFPRPEQEFFTMEMGTSRGAWRFQTTEDAPHLELKGPSFFYWSSALYWLMSGSTDFGEFYEKVKSLDHDNIPITNEDLDKLKKLVNWPIYFHPGDIFASAPVRSKPLRIYDPIAHLADPTGTHVPAHLAGLYSDHNQWNQIKGELDRFGHDSGLFDEIDIKRFEELEGAPFKLEIKQANGDKRNLIDVGYGISQVLPVIYELFRKSGASMFLFQQPEVHLHPSAQAALGSLFCEIASAGRQSIIETHSDYILDRVLLDIRDKKTKLTANDVSILYFENAAGHASIHPIGIDNEGNILQSPDGYRKFFKKELDRLIDY